MRITLTALAAALALGAGAAVAQDKTSNLEDVFIKLTGRELRD